MPEIKAITDQQLQDLFPELRREQIQSMVTSINKIIAAQGTERGIISLAGMVQATHQNIKKTQALRKTYMQMQ